MTSDGATGDPARLLTPAGRARPLLFDAFPALAARTPWMPLAHVPTPVEPCRAAAEWLGSDSGVYMKRDDLVSPLYGGNKVRRYEFVLADAGARGKRRLVTVGGLASTQAMATAIFGRALGFEVRIVLFDQPITSFAVDAVRGFVASGAEVVYGGGYTRTALRALAAQARGRGDNYFIMPGAASPLANLGYVDGLLELAAQVARGEAPRPDVIVLPTGSSGTLAALALGAAHLGWPTEVVGVRISSSLVTNRVTASAVVRATDRALAAADPRWEPVAGRARYRLHGDELGRGYGHPTDAARAGALAFERLVGAPGEITYSGKALAGLRALLRLRAYEGKTFLFWNTLSRARPALPPDVDARVPRDLAWIFDAARVA